MSWNGTIVFLGSSDLDDNAVFYRDTLGLKLFKDQGVCRIYEVPGGGYLGFCTHLEKTQQGKAPIITILAEDVDYWYSILKDCGWEIEDEPRLNPKFNIYHFFTRDPDGYTVEIQKFL